MTVQNIQRYIEYQGNGITVDFAYSFYVLEDDELGVTLDGVTQILDTDYTLVNSDDPANPGGTVTFNDAPTGVVRIFGQTELEQQKDYTAYDPFPAASHERGLDRAMLIAQEQEEKIASASGNLNYVLKRDPQQSPSNWLGENRRLTDLADPINNQDALTLGNALARQLVGGTGPAGLPGPAGFGVVVADYAALRALVAPIDGDIALVQQTGLAGTFQYLGSATDADNGGTVILPDDGTPGAWVRLYLGEVWGEWFGAVGDGLEASASANDSAIGAMIGWIEDKEETGRFGPGVFKHSQGFLVSNTCQIRGSGFGQTFFSPVDAFSGWFLSLNDVWRSTGESGAAPEFDPDVAKSRVILGDFSYFSTRSATGTQHGIRTYNRVDEFIMERVAVLHLNGTALSIGTYSDGLVNPLCRESTLYNVTVRKCGTNGAHPAYEFRSTDILGTGTGDATNQMTFFEFGAVYNYANGIIEGSVLPGEVYRQTRRFRFYGFKLHGWNDSVEAPAADLLQVIGNVDDLRIYGLKANGSHDIGGTKYACIRFKESTEAGADNFPRYVYIEGDVRTCAGHGYVVERLQWGRIEGTIEAASVAGNEVRFAANSVDNKGDVEYNVQSNDNQRSIFVDPTVGKNTVSMAVLANELPAVFESGKLQYAGLDGDAAFYSGTQADPNGVVTAGVGSIYIRRGIDYDASVNGIWYKTTQTGNTGWARMQYNLLTFTAQLDDITSPVNTQGKYEGMQQFDQTANRPVWATGAGAGSVWVDGTGTTVNTPA